MTPREELGKNTKTYKKKNNTLHEGRGKGDKTKLTACLHTCTDEHSWAYPIALTHLLFIPFHESLLCFYPIARAQKLQQESKPNQLQTPQKLSQKLPSSERLLANSVCPEVSDVFGYYMSLVKSQIFVVASFICLPEEGVKKS